MLLVLVIILNIIGLIFKDVGALPCLTDKSKTKFDSLKKALGALQTSIDDKIESLQSDVKNKVKKIDDDMDSLVSDFQSECS